MKRRVCCSCLLRVSSCPQYGQRFHPSGYVRLHDVQRTLLGSGIEIGAHCTLRIVDENRRKTLQALIGIASESAPTACWGDERAMALLRSQATADELREAGADEALIAHIYAEPHAC